MELNVIISVVVLLPVAVALVAGGLVLYRRSTRAGWRAAGMGSLALGVGTLVVFTLTLPVFQSSEGETPEPVIVGGLVPTPSTDAPATQPVSSGSMIARPPSIEALVAWSHIIVLGTINSVLDERVIYYGEDGNPVPADEESGSPYTDYEVRIESALKDDGRVESGGVLVLRMFGHLSQQNDIVTLAPVRLPQPGSHYLLALGRNPDNTYGSGSEGLIYVDGETVTYVDGVAFSTELTGEEFVEAVRQEIGRKSLSATPTSIETAPTTSGVVLTEDKFRDLITVEEDVETHLSVKVSLKAEFRDFKDMAGRAGPSQVEKIDSWYGMTIEAADGGPGMTFSVVDFDSESSAEDHFVAVMSETSVLRQMTPPIGDISARVELNAEGIGSMLVFTSGDKVVSMHTMQSEGLSPLVSLEDLEELAALVMSRL